MDITEEYSDDVGGADGRGADDRRDGDGGLSVPADFNVDRAKG